MKRRMVRSPGFVDTLEDLLDPSTMGVGPSPDFLYLYVLVAFRVNSQDGDQKVSRAAVRRTGMSHPYGRSDVGMELQKCESGV